MLLQLVVVAVLSSLVSPETVHWQWRVLDCSTRNGTGVDLISPEPASCSLLLKETEFDDNERVAPTNPCFEETVNGTRRWYCDVLCPGADTVYLIKRKPQTHRSCFVYYTHGLEKRRKGQEWLLWRAAKCAHSRIAFTIRCEFLSARADYFKDQELFSKLKRKAIH